jgi:glycosyltransferase involved in cell wall biosynthesis
MLSPLVSICIPTYNGEKFLKECIESCLNQSFTDYEIVICDDGSTDKTVEIIESYSQTNKLIRFYRNEKNLGLVGNWNRCIEHAKGQWIKFVFQDDYITKDCLEKFVNAIDDSIQLIVSERNFILPENASDDYRNYYTNVVRTLNNTSSQNSFISPKQISKLAIDHISMNFIAEPSLTFFRRSVVDEIGEFNPDLKQICDLEFVLRLASKYGLKHLPLKLCAFRIHQGSTTSSNLSDNYFQLHYIEPLLFSWCLLYDEKFSALRSHLNVVEKQKLKLYFKLKAYKAYKANEKGVKQHAMFDKASHSFKEINENKEGSVLVRLLAKVI